MYLLSDYFSVILGSRITRFAILSLVLLVFVIRSYWNARSSPRFWAAFAVFGMLHLVTVGALYFYGRGLPFALVGIIGGSEIILFGFIVYNLLGLTPGP